MAHSSSFSVEPAPPSDWDESDGGRVIAPDFAQARRAKDEGTSARDKLKPIADLAAFAERCRSAGKKVVLAHGVFDLVHLGHVRHLESAAREGDVLIVSVTADRFVNKGPGRPVFSARLRGEMLAALECVGAVGISDAPGADEMIRQVRPDVYVKGPDYRDQDDDITGKINAERQAVEQYGGRIAFTDDMVLSSSQLINDHFSLLDPQVQNFLNGLRVGGALPQVMNAIDSIADMKVLFVGDAIIDEYQYSSAMGKSAKENIIASRSVGSEMFAGGVVAREVQPRAREKPFVYLYWVGWSKQFRYSAYLFQFLGWQRPFCVRESHVVTNNTFHPVEHGQSRPINANELAHESFQ